MTVLEFVYRFMAVRTLVQDYSYVGSWMFACRFMTIHMLVHGSLYVGS